MVSKMVAHADTPRNACRLAQQAAEKSLKAAFVLEGMDFPYIHDLDKLRDSLPAGWPAKETRPNPTGPTERAAEARRPEVAPELNCPRRVQSRGRRHTRRGGRRV